MADDQIALNASPWERYAKDQQDAGPWTKYGAGRKDHGIDWSQPVADVRAKVAALPEDQRQDALKQWADAYVDKERKAGGVGMMADNTMRTLARGTFVGPFLDEANAATSAATHTLTGGAFGAPYDETLAYNRARDRAVDKDYPVMATSGKIAAGLAGGGVALAGRGGTLVDQGARALVGGPLVAMAPSATVAGRVGQAAGTGAGYGAVAGFGAGEGGIGNRLESAARGGAFGTVLGTGVGVAGEGVRQIARARANLGEAGAYGRTAESLGQPIDDFATQVATGATRSDAAINTRTLNILGEEMTRAAGDVPRAQQATIARIVAEQGVTPQTAAAQIRRLSAVHESSPLMFAEYPAVAEGNAATRMARAATANADDLNRTVPSGPQRMLDYLANNGSAPSAVTTRRAVDARQEQLAPTFEEALGRMGPQVQTGARGTRPATIADAADMINTARQSASTEYARATANQAPFEPQLTTVLRNFESTIRGRSTEEARSLQQAIERFMDPIQVQNASTGQPGLVQWRTVADLGDFIQRRSALNRQIQDSYRIHPRTGEEIATTSTRDLLQLKSAIDTAVGAANPTWLTANRRWADFELERIGTRLGDTFAGRAGPQFREQLNEFQRLAPEAQRVVQIHFVQKMYDKLANLGDTHSVSKMFTNDHTRAMVRAVLGDEAAVSFTRAVRDQRVAEASKHMMGNSATHMRGQMQKQMDADTGLSAAVDMANKKGIQNWLLEKGTQLVTEQRNRPLSRILTTPMSDTAQIARHIHGMRQQQNRLRQYETPSLVPLMISGAAGQAVAEPLSVRGR